MRWPSIWQRSARHPRQRDRIRPNADRTYARELYRSRSTACDRGSDPARAARTTRRSRRGVLFLASDESRWVTGSTVTVDGGVGFRAELLVLGYERQQPGQSDFHHRVLWSIGMASESAGSPPAPRSLIYSPTAQIAGALRASGRKLPAPGWRAIGECGRSVGWTCQSSVPVAASAHPAR
jgi:hypothetical protein